MAACQFARLSFRQSIAFWLCPHLRHSILLMSGELTTVIGEIGALFIFSVRCASARAFLKCGHLVWGGIPVRRTEQGYTSY